jgi:hypothetical protein
MDIPNNVSHQPKSAAKALMNTTLINKERHAEGVEYTEGIEFIENEPRRGDMIEPYAIKITRATSELSGAYPFLFKDIAYILSHEELKNAFYEKIDRGFYDSIVLPLDIFLHISLGDTKGVRSFLMSELKKLEDKKPSKVIPFDENTSVYGQPIILTIGRKKSGFIKNLNKNTLDNNTEVQILFMKCFFRSGSFVQEPLAIYAKLIQAQMDSVRTMAAMESGGGPEAMQNIPVKIEHDPYIQTSAINRVREWIYIHDNGKNKNITHDQIMILDLLKNSEPQYLQKNRKGQDSIKDANAAYIFLWKALHVIKLAYLFERGGRRVTDFELKRNPLKLVITFDGSDHPKRERELFDL